MPPTRPTLFPSPLIGWREDVRLPQLGAGLLVAKVDTGARSAALHAEDIVVKGKRVTFTLELDGRRQAMDVALAGRKRVKSSNGHSETRAVIETTIEIGHHAFAAEVTLTDRADMGVPMLLGRKTIKGRFLVHPGRSFLISRKKKKIS
jgi:hypothetical protein